LISKLPTTPRYLAVVGASTLIFIEWNAKKPIHLIVDSTGLALIDNVAGDIDSLTADAAYDTIAIYDASVARGAVGGRRSRCTIARAEWKTPSTGTRRLLATAGQLCWPSSCDCVGRDSGPVIQSRKKLRRLPATSSIG
jgi:hypothetical protein